MTKERRTVSLDEDVDAYLDREGVNASELVNSLVKQHRNGGGASEVVIGYRQEELRADIDALESRVEVRKRQLEDLQDLEDEHDKSRRRVLDERLRSMNRQNMKLVKDHPSVENIAADFYDGDVDAAYRALIERNDEIQAVSDDHFLDA